MPMTIGQDSLVLDGEIRIEEADTLHAALLERMRPIDLGPCIAVHTAVLGVLLAARPPLVRLPADPFLAGLLAGLEITPSSPKPKKTAARKRSPRALATAGALERSPSP